MRLHELLMDMITEHNYGVPIPLSHDDHSSHMDDIHTEMEKRLIVFLALPGNRDQLKNPDISGAIFTLSLSTNTEFSMCRGRQISQSSLIDSRFLLES